MEISNSTVPADVLRLNRALGTMVGFILHIVLRQSNFDQARRHDSNYCILVSERWNRSYISAGKSTRNMRSFQLSQLNGASQSEEEQKEKESVHENGNFFSTPVASKNSSEDYLNSASHAASSRRANRKY